MRLSFIAAFVVAGMAIGAVATSLALRPADGLDDGSVRAIVGEMLDARADGPMSPVTAEPSLESRMSSAAINPATLDPMIESYLLSNPRILQKMTVALNTELRDEKIATARAAVVRMHDQIFDDPDQVVLGNPDGDVTLVEMFDYNCGYCRSSMPDMATLLDTDPKLRVILKEFPILTQGSVEAARVAVVLNRHKVDYWRFHEALFTSPGQVDGTVAAAAAEQLGLNGVTLQLDAAAQDVTDALQRNHDLAQALGVTGTPAYIIGDEIISGAIGIDGLKERIANMRACGHTFCDG